MFARRGFHAASVDEIAEEAGFSVGALYSNFSSKHELLLATAEEFVKAQAATWARRFDEAADLESEIRAPADAWMAEVRTDPDQFLLFIELWAYAVRDEAIRPLFAERWTAGREFFDVAVRSAAQDAGVSISDERAEQMSAIIDALGIGFAVRKLIDPTAVPDGLFGQVLVDIVPVLLDIKEASEEQPRRRG